jgi:phage baseplate assembly protein W
MAITISRGFKDISLSFARHPVTNDIVVLKNEDAIKKSVINLVRTRIGERFFNNLLGTTVESSLFELQNLELAALLEEQIRTVLVNFERRIVVKSVYAEAVEDSYEIQIRIEYDIVGQGFPPQKIDFLLQPTRI